jgi:trk system potassium uptake protein
VIETAIGDESRAAGRVLADIDLPPGTIVAAVIRRGRPTVPVSTLRLEAGDELLVVSSEATEQDVHTAFQ